MTPRALLAVALLAGCATGVPVERQVVVSGDRFTAVQGEAAFFVRSFLADEIEGERREVVGATCHVASSLDAADLVTPARLVVPNFGPQSPEIAVSWTAGDWSGAGVARIVTSWDQPPGYWGGMAGPYWPGGFYPGWDGGWWAGPGVPVSRYPDLRVILR
jgi:hypothetical protein